MANYVISECSAEAYQTASKTLRQDRHSEPISFLQAPFYGNLQASTGKTIVYCTIYKADSLIGCALAVVYTAPGGLRFLYSPYGPVCTEWNQQLYDALRAFYGPVAKRLGCTFVRLDNDTLSDSTKLKPIAAKLARTASLQPRSEWVIDITPGKDTLWASFHKHARYNVRLAERANADIQIYEPAKAPLEDFFSLMQATSKRDKFGIFDRNYYESYLQTLSEQDGFVIVCSVDGKPAATGLFVVYDKQAHYVFAGSSNDFRKIAPAYTVIWHALQEAERRACTRFNFGGIVDEVKSQDLGGVTAFKKRFGGYAINHRNPIDIVYKPAQYFMFKLYKNLR